MIKKKQDEGTMADSWRRVSREYRVAESTSKFQNVPDGCHGGALNNERFFCEKVYFAQAFFLVEGYHGGFVAARVEGVVRSPQKHLI